jgi:GntR family transcriptional regulator
VLKIDPKDAVPIWKQIEEGVRRLAASGTLAPGSAVPSVRDLARELGVNPMTVSKAYQRLTEAGVLDVRRGAGTFVAAAPPGMTKSERIRLLCEAATRFVTAAAPLGVPVEEAVREVQAAWPRRRKGDHS